MILRTALCFLLTCSTNVIARPDFIIDHGASRAEVKPSILFNESIGILTLSIEGDPSQEVVADLSNNLQEIPSEKCTHANAEFCKRWVPQNENIELTIGFEKGGWRQITWISNRKTHKNCFPLGDHSWFGGPEQRNQYWPVQKLNFNDWPFVTNNFSNMAIADPFWFNSNGLAIAVDKGVPLFIDQDSTKKILCFTAKHDPPYRPRKQVVLSYKIGYHKNAKKAFMKSVNDILGKPSGIPDERMIRHPVWSTWALFKVHINESVVRNFANDIKRYGFQNSQLEIDDNWETCYGHAEFDPDKFPDITKLVNDLKRDGFRVTLWTHPFVNTNCSLYEELQEKGYLVKNENGTVTNWWNGEAGIIDFTNWDAAKDYEKRQQENLKKTGIDGLKFDAGEVNWLPKNPYFPNIPSSPYENYPSQHTNDYVRTVAKFNSLTEVRSAHWTQDLPIFLRMIDKDTKWGYDNGLKSLVTTLLQMNMVGYPLVLPDMIGGNVYEGDTLTKELFIRWLQANTFMPALQYSRVPWEFDDETIEIAKHFAELHSNYTDKIVSLMENSTKYGTPVNPPIWWNDPTDKEALEIDSEYLLGEDILVAPVLDQGAVSRHIYLPAGKWKEMGSEEGKIYSGKKWLLNYKAPLKTLPYFIRVTKSNSNGLASSGVMLSATLLLAITSVLKPVYV